MLLSSRIYRYVSILSAKIALALFRNDPYRKSTHKNHVSSGIVCNYVNREDVCNIIINVRFLMALQH